MLRGSGCRNHTKAGAVDSYVIGVCARGLNRHPGAGHHDGGSVDIEREPVGVGIGNASLVDTIVGDRHAICITGNHIWPESFRTAFIGRARRLREHQRGAQGNNRYRQTERRAVAGISALDLGYATAAEHIRLRVDGDVIGRVRVHGYLDTVDLDWFGYS